MRRAAPMSKEDSVSAFDVEDVSLRKSNLWPSAPPSISEEFDMDAKPASSIRNYFFKKSMFMFIPVVALVYSLAFTIPFGESAA